MSPPRHKNVMNNGHLESFYVHEVQTHQHKPRENKAIAQKFELHCGAKCEEEYLCCMSRVFSAFLVVCVASVSTNTWSQVDTTITSNAWWKVLFRPSEEVSPLPTSDALDSLKDLSVTQLFPHSEMLSKDSSKLAEFTATLGHLATFSWALPAEIARLDSIDKADPKPLQGYRIQIYFGELQEARAVRAAFRRDYPNFACELMPIAPNYAVTVGNFRDQWSARRALRDGSVGSWKHSLVIPSPIDLPVLR